MTRSFLVTGTDTGVGKTHVTVLLVRAAVAAGRRVAVMKPVAAGVHEGAAMNDDVALLLAAGNVAAPLADVNPYAFRAAIAPHIAARNEGRTIDMAALAAAHARLAAGADDVFVEGAGGALVPLGPTTCVLDLADALDLQVLLVVGIRLGCINHALLSVEAIRSRRLAFAGWIANRIDPVMPAADASVAAIAERVGMAPLADLAFGAFALPSTVLANVRA